MASPQVQVRAKTGTEVTGSYSWPSYRLPGPFCGAGRDLVSLGKMESLSEHGHPGTGDTWLLSKPVSPSESENPERQG